ncbi:MAG: DUF4279 domain-containing protein [Clostridia bacterium]|nr:DUF4279 domain-containing protein [Clostridia bacterium]
MLDETSRINHASIALLVTGREIDAQKITELLEMEPTRVIHEGDLLNRLPEIRARDDEWMYVLQLEKPKGRDETLLGLLQHLMDKKAELQEIRDFGAVALRLTVQSNRAQMAYSLSPDTIEALHRVGLPLDVSSLSWGEVGM